MEELPLTVLSCSLNTLPVEAVGVQHLGLKQQNITVAITKTDFIVSK